MPQLVAGVVALALTIGMHLVLTRTAIGSQLLAVAEDRNAAMLMGIRPDRMQALAWGLSAAGAGIAGALDRDLLLRSRRRSARSSRSPPSSSSPSAASAACPAR